MLEANTHSSHSLFVLLRSKKKLATATAESAAIPPDFGFVKLSHHFSVMKCFCCVSTCATQCHFKAKETERHVSFMHCRNFKASNPGLNFKPALLRPNMVKFVLYQVSRQYFYYSYFIQYRGMAAVEDWRRRNHAEAEGTKTHALWTQTGKKMLQTLQTTLCIFSKSDVCLK